VIAPSSFLTSFIAISRESTIPAQLQFAGGRSVRFLFGLIGRRWLIGVLDRAGFPEAVGTIFFHLSVQNDVCERLIEEFHTIVHAHIFHRIHGRLVFGWFNGREEIGAVGLDIGRVSIENDED
jgi:hypothetical protein